MSSDNIDINGNSCVETRHRDRPWVDTAVVLVIRLRNDELFTFIFGPIVLVLLALAVTVRRQYWRIRNIDIFCVATVKIGYAIEFKMLFTNTVVCVSPSSYVHLLEQLVGCRRWSICCEECGRSKKICFWWRAREKMKRTRGTMDRRNCYR